MGEKDAAKIESEVPVVHDTAVDRFVTELGRSMASRTRRADLDCHFTVVNSPEVNAFALPGGFFYVNKGLILAADNEAELAGVMAHEIAHVAARHAMENERKMQIIDYGLLAGVLLGGGIIGNVLYNGGGLIEGLTFLKFTRGAEEEADKLGVQYMWAAGYDPNAMATMFEKLEAKNKKKPGTISKLFATHPAPPDRRAAAISLAARFPERPAILTTGRAFTIASPEPWRASTHSLALPNAPATAVAASVSP